MGQDRDDYMRRQGGEHAMLDMRDPSRIPRGPAEAHRGPLKPWPSERPNVVTATKVSTESKMRVVLGDKAIRTLLTHAGIIIPAGATITVSIPGGGDYSNTDLDIDDRCPVVVAWTEVVEA